MECTYLTCFKPLLMVLLDFCHCPIGALRRSLQDRLSKGSSGKNRDEIYLKLRTSTGWCFIYTWFLNFTRSYAVRWVSKICLVYGLNILILKIAHKFYAGVMKLSFKCIEIFIGISGSWVDRYMINWSDDIIYNVYV